MIALRKDKDISPQAAPGSAEAPRPFFAFAGDQATADIIREVAELRGFSEDAIVISELDDAIDGLANIRTPKVLLVDLGHAPDIMVEAERLAQVCDPEARVILLGEVNDLHVYRDLIAAGVADYVIKPFDAMALGSAIDRARPTVSKKRTERAGAETPDVLADVVAVIGARGGVGASTIAANLAWLGATSLDKSVVLIDMDLTFGTQALLMDIDPGGGLGDAMMAPGRMDELFVKRASISVTDKLRVMAAETDPAKGDIASAEAFKGLLDYVRPESELIIVDLPRSVIVSQPEILENFKRIVIVAEPSLAAMRDSARLAAIIKSINPVAGTSVVLNRVGMAPNVELSQKVFEDGAGLKVHAALPFDAKTAFGAEAAGKCVAEAAARSKLGKGLTKIAALAAGDDQAISTTSANSLFAKLRGIRKQDAEQGGR